MKESSAVKLHRITENLEKWGFSPAQIESILLLMTDYWNTFIEEEFPEVKQ